MLRCESLTARNSSPLFESRSFDLPLIHNTIDRDVVYCFNSQNDPSLCERRDEHKAPNKQSLSHIQYLILLPSRVRRASNLS